MRFRSPEFLQKEWMARNRVPLLAAALAGLSAVILLERERAHWREQAGLGATVPIVTLASAIPQGEPVETRHLALRSIPRTAAHPLAVRPEDREILVGMRAERALTAGQPLLWSDLAAPQGDEELTALVRPNERAVALPVNDLTGAGRLIRVNDHIDIFGTFRRPEGTVTIPVLQNVIVVALGNGAGGAGTLSVSVTQPEAALLTLAQQTGKLTYALRNPLDHDTAEDLARVSLANLFEEDHRRHVQEARNRNIRVFKGKL